MVQEGGVGNSLIWAPTDEPPHMRGGVFLSAQVILLAEPGRLIDRPGRP